MALARAESIPHYCNVGAVRVSLGPTFTTTRKLRFTNSISAGIRALDKIKALKERKHIGSVVSKDTMCYINITFYQSIFLKKQYNMVL